MVSNGCPARVPAMFEKVPAIAELRNMIQDKLVSVFISEFSDKIFYILFCSADIFFNFLKKLMIENY